MVNHIFFSSLSSSKVYSFRVVIRDCHGNVYSDFRVSLSGEDVDLYFLTLRDSYPSVCRIRVYLLPSNETVLHL